LRSSDLPGVGADAEGFFARTVPAYPLQGVALGELLTAQKAGEVALVVGTDDVSGSITPTLTESLSANGGELVVTATVADAAGVASAASNVTTATPGAVALATPGAGERP